MKTIDFSYFIERYNAGEMNTEEKKWFEKELEGNEKLRREVELRKKTEAILKDSDIMALRNKLNSIEKKRVEQPPVRRSSAVSRNIKYVAAAGVFVVFGAIALLRSDNVSNSEIFEKFYRSYEVTAPSRSAASGINQDFLLGVEYYKVHDYKSAALYFSKVVEQDSKNMESTLLYGVSNFEISNYPEAEESFVKVIDDNDNLFIEEARWYLALCYIRSDENDRAVKQLTEIKNSRSIYRKEAAKILRKIA